jgi:hypothetical protein
MWYIFIEDVRKCLDIEITLKIISEFLSYIVHLHPVAHCYYTFTFFPSLCGLSLFKTLYSVLNTCHF